MKRQKENPTKELYRQLRTLTCARLWEEEVTRFDRASPRERAETVAVVRAVGVVFSESGTAEQKVIARSWLRGLLHDPEEKIRRYAMAALPKLDACAEEETALLGLLKNVRVDREKRFLGQALEKIGGSSTLRALEEGSIDLPTRQKISASVARSERPSAIRLDAVLASQGLRMNLRGRAGLESIVRDEVNESQTAREKFRVEAIGRGSVGIASVAPFTLGDLFQLRCFEKVGFELGHANDAESLAALITSPLARRLFETFTEGSMRYRLDFVGRGHQRGEVRAVANRAFALCPEILNDARLAPWTVAIHPGGLVELIPKLVSDPRLYFRQQDVPAASHPPLAACMARLAGEMDGEIVWDPFCGSGLELIERALLGGVREVHGTDLSAEAIAIAEGNIGAARLGRLEAKFTCTDFRDHARTFRPGSVSLVITNPPLGKRVPIPNLRGLIDDLFSVAAKVLKPGGRLVFANPFRMESPEPSLQRQFRQKVDFGGFDCWLEKYRKQPRGG